MIQVPDYLLITDRGLNHCLDNIRLAVEHIWDYPLIQYYTDHSNKHSERIIKILGKLLKGYRFELNEYERFILLASAYLHDIGMQSPSHAGLERKPKYSDEEEGKIRERHNETSAKMIVDSLSSSSSIKLGLEICPRMARFVALVCKYHRNLSLDDLKDVSLYGEKIRIRLLAGLLRLGDELDADDRRVDISALKLREIPAKSKYHWWAHHYVSSIDIEDGQITLHFEFPTKYRASMLIRELRDKIKTSIELQCNGVYDLFYHYGLYLHKEIKCTEDYSEIGLEAMPTDLEDYIRAKIGESELAEEPKSPPEETVPEYLSTLKSLSTSTTSSLEKIATECTNPELNHVIQNAIAYLRSIENETDRDKLPSIIGQAVEYIYILLEKASIYGCYNMISILTQTLGKIGTELSARKDFAEITYIAADRLDKSIKIVGELKDFAEKSAVISQSVKDIAAIGRKAAENSISNVASRCAYAFGSIGPIAIDNGLNRDELRSHIKSVLDVAEVAAKTDSKMGSAIYHIGRSYNALNYCPEAEDASRKATQIDHPQRVLAFLQLSNALICQDKDIEARKVLDEYKKLKSLEQTG